MTSIKNIIYTIATLEDINNILELHSKYHVDTIESSDKPDGFITTNFSKKQLQNLIIQEQGIFIAKLDEEIIGYVMSASWDYWQQWPIFSFMSEQLNNKMLQNCQINKFNSYQYGPVCIDRKYRSLGIFKKLFEFSLEQMSKKYKISVTFINKINIRSLNAHINKTALEIINEFEFNQNQYYELACFTSNEGN